MVYFGRVQLGHKLCSSRCSFLGEPPACELLARERAVTPDRSRRASNENIGTRKPSHRGPIMSRFLHAVSFQVDGSRRSSKNRREGGGIGRRFKNRTLTIDPRANHCTSKTVWMLSVSSARPKQTLRCLRPGLKLCGPIQSTCVHSPEQLCKTGARRSHTRHAQMARTTNGFDAWKKHRANLKSRRETKTVLALSIVVLTWRACGGDWWQTLLICSKERNSDVFGKATVRCTNQSSGIAVERHPMPCFEAVLFRRSRVSLVVLCMTHETNLGQDHRARSSPSSLLGPFAVVNPGGWWRRRMPQATWSQLLGL